VIHDLRSEYRRQQAVLRQKREAEALMRDMEARRSGAGGRDASATDTLLRERGSLASSHKVMDGMLEQAAATREALRQQRGSLMNAAGGVGALAARFPGVGALIGAIQRRRTRDQRIIALLIAACICFTLWYTLR
jgi:Golgi SNAP receptor complex protein 1